MINIGDKVISIKNTEAEPEGFIGYVIDNKAASNYPIAVQRSDSNYVAAFTEDELAVLVKGPIKDLIVAPEEEFNPKYFDFIKSRVIGVTQPVVDFIPDAEGIISYTARVSSPDNQTQFDTAAKLLKYCMKNNHWSVFDMADLIIEIEVPRDIARQVLRHSSMKFQEFSQRYAVAQNFVIRETRLQDTKNRQNSIEVNLADEDQFNLTLEWEKRQQEVIDLVKKNYKWAIDNGIAKECARVITPEGNTMSYMYAKASVRSWITYLNVRDDSGVTQKEHVYLAKACRPAIEKYFPFLSELV